MLTTKFLKGIMTEAYPVIKRQLDDAKTISGFRDVVAANGGDWSALKALIKAHVEDQDDEAGEGKRVKKILDKAESSTAYADMLGLIMNEQNFSGHDEDGVFPDDEQQPAPTARDLTVPQALTGQVATHTPDHSPDAGNMVEAAPVPSQAANVGGDHETVIDALIIEKETADAKSSGLDIENTMKRDSASEASVSDVETVAPLYAEPGVVVYQQNGPEPMVAHPFATCWPVNTIDVSGGVEKPIVKIGGLILDGRGRYLAARKVRTSPTTTMEYPTVQYDGDDDLADSITWNLASRPNMDPRALRIVAEKLAKLVPDRAEEIMDRFGFSEAQEAAE